MCGIVGYTGSQAAAPILLDGLKKLEYRGYDSAGIAVLHDNMIAVSKVTGRIANLCENTNIEATFDMLLNVAVSNGCSQDDLPEYLCIVSDMEFDQGTRNWSYGYNHTTFNTKTLMESIRAKWANYGLRMPKIIYWNVDARHNNIPEDLGCGDISYVSGMSPSIFDTLMSGKSGYELMMAKLDSPRYKVIY